MPTIALTAAEHASLKRVLEEEGAALVAAVDGMPYGPKRTAMARRLRRIIRVWRACQPSDKAKAWTPFW